MNSFWSSLELPFGLTCSCQGQQWLPDVKSNCIFSDLSDSRKQVSSFSLGIPPLLRFYQTSLYHQLFHQASWSSFPVIVPTPLPSLKTYENLRVSPGHSALSTASPKMICTVQASNATYMPCLCIINLHLKSLTCFISLLRNQLPTWHPNLEVILPQI